jgi:hypothetical protein
VLPKRRRDFDSSPDDDYERVSVRDVQLLDPAPTVILAAEPPSLSPMAVEMAVELEETVLALTKLPTPPGSARPSVAWIATIFSMSTVMSLTATLVLRGGEAPPARVAAAAAGLVAPPISPPALVETPIAAAAVVVPVAAEPEVVAIPVDALPPAPVVAETPVVPRRHRAPASAPTPAVAPAPAPAPAAPTQAAEEQAAEAP